MRISIGSLLDGAKQATGAVAIIDVFRAFTTAAVALANGASRIIMVSAVEEALSLRDSGAAQICMGECSWQATARVRLWQLAIRNLRDVDFRNKTISQRTWVRARRASSRGARCGLPLCGVVGNSKGCNREGAPLVWR